MKLKVVFMLFLSLFLIGCSKTVPELKKEEISKEQAEQIAIETATAEGYKDPELFTEYDVETKKAYHYSIKQNKDVEVWTVRLLTSEREHVEGMLGDLEYYINIYNGEVIDKISGVD